MNERYLAGLEKMVKKLIIDLKDLERSIKRIKGVILEA